MSREQIPDYLFNEVLLFFKGDNEKTLLWFTTANPLLGNIVPLTMIKVGREKRLEAFIKDAREQGGW